MERFSECWSNVETWLNLSASLIFSSLNPPATTTELDSVEEYYGVKLPADYRALYSTHNGQNDVNLVNLFYGLPFFSLSEGTENQEMLVVSSMEYIDFSNFVYVSKEIDRSNESPLFKIPISGGIDVYAVFVDLKPSDMGKFGQVVFIDFESNIALKLADSVTDMVCMFHEDILSGKYTLNTESHMESGAWLDAAKEIDVVNWYAYNQDNLPEE